ncbi:MAG: hypothetical protein ABIJ97_17960 [Bacteroidota bacterium]
MIYKVPEVGEIEIKTLVFDLNGTISNHGKVIDGVVERMNKLKKSGFRLIMITSDQRGLGENTAESLGIEYFHAATSADKEKIILALDPMTIAAFGNARVDIGMFHHARVSIACIEGEGIHTEIFKFADILVKSINDALDLFLDHDSFISTMKR